MWSKTAVSGYFSRFHAPLVYAMDPNSRFEFTILYMSFVFLGVKD